MRSRAVVFFVIIGLACIHATRADVTWPSGFDEELVADGLDTPTAFAFAPDGRILIAEKAGRVRVIDSGGQLLSTPAASVSVSTEEDLGLLGITVDPQFLTNHFIYLAYTTQIVPPNPPTAYSKVHRITRMTMSGNVVIPGSELILVDDIPSDATSHTGGALRFGPDGKLYASTGEGASYSFTDPLSLRASNLDNLAGKILRINRDGSAPADNPFYTTPGAIRSKVWQSGLRNPFKTTFRPGTGKLYVNDVGSSYWEEINVAPAGTNFGWPCFEGDDPQPAYTGAFPAQCSTVSNTDPIHFYGHVSGNGCITGAAFYAGANYPAEYLDKYFISDYTLHWIRYVEVTPDDDVVSVNDFANGDFTFLPVDLQLAPDGDLYYLNIATDFSIPSGSVSRIRYVGAGNHAPVPSVSATPTFGYAPLSVSFSAAGSIDADNDPLTYHWVFGDGGSADGLTATHGYASNGTYVALLQVGDGHVTRQAEVTITVGSRPPTATIVSPSNGYAYSDGEVIDYSGSATDPDEGTLGSNALHWTVLLHHNSHQHIYQDSIGASGSFVAEGHGDTGDTFYYEVVLTATDATGLSDVARRDVVEYHAPIANAGLDQAVPCYLPTPTVVLDGTGSVHAESLPLTYSWTQTSGPAVVLSGPTAPAPSFTVPVLAGGATLGFRLEVDDGRNSSEAVTTVSVPDLIDTDQDLAPSCNDCAPSNSSVRPPLEVQGLWFGADKATLTWSAVSGATAYDLERGRITSPFSYVHDCRAEALASPTTVDGDVPDSGAGFYYLARATSGCGLGDLGAARDGRPRTNLPCGSGGSHDPVTIDFDDVAAPNYVLNGEYPAGVINWGQGDWYLSAPWQSFTTNSVNFNGPAPTSKSLTFVTPKILSRIDAYNGQSQPCTVTLSCAGHPTKQVALGPDTIATIQTGWTSPCSVLTIGATNGWWTNFDNLEIR